LVLATEGEGNFKIPPVSKSSTKLRMHDNHIVVAPVNILMVWHTGFLSHMTHYVPCVLIIATVNQENLVIKKLLFLAVSMKLKAINYIPYYTNACIYINVLFYQELS